MPFLKEKLLFPLSDWRATGSHAWKHLAANYIIPSSSPVQDWPVFMYNMSFWRGLGHLYWVTLKYKNKEYSSPVENPSWFFTPCSCHFLTTDQHESQFLFPWIVFNFSISAPPGCTDGMVPALHWMQRLPLCLILTQPLLPHPPPRHRGQGRSGL